MVVFTRPQPHGSRGGGQRQQRLPRTDAGPRHRPPQQRRPHTSGGGGPAVAAVVPALGAPGPTGTARHQRSQVLGALRPNRQRRQRGGAPHFAPPATKATCFRRVSWVFFLLGGLRRTVACVAAAGLLPVCWRYRVKPSPITTMEVIKYPQRSHIDILTGAGLEHTPSTK